MVEMLKKAVCFQIIQHHLPLFSLVNYLTVCMVSVTFINLLNIHYNHWMKLILKMEI